MHNWLKYTALATVVGLAACTSSPTGRNQLLLFSDQDMSALGAQSFEQMKHCLLYTSPSPRDGRISRMPSSA